MENQTRPTPETDAAICSQEEYDSYEAYIDSLEDHARKLERERDEALQWKREQMLVESQWDAQAVAKELGMPAGADIRKNILPAIQQLKRERNAMLEAMRDAHGALENLISAKSGGMQPANALIDATFAAKAAVKKLKPFLP